MAVSDELELDAIERSQEPEPAAAAESITLTATLFGKLPPVLARALQLAAIPYWFDLPMLVALRGPDDADGRTPKIMDWLKQRSFIAPLPGDRYVMSTDMRGLIRARWTKDRPGFSEANRRLAEHAATRLEHVSGPEADEWTQIRIYARLGMVGDVGLDALQRAFTAAESAHRLAVAERLIEVAAEQGQFLSPRESAWVEYLRVRMTQLHNRWEESCTQARALIERPDLPAELRPHVQYALATGLIETGRWTKAIELHRQALGNFEANGQYDQVAACQLGLGYAHMDLAFNVWGQRESRPLPPPSLKQTLVDLITLPVRLPILLYVLFSVKEADLFPAWLVLARGVDWTIARLLVQAAHWYRLALQHMEAAHNTDGILRAQDSLARLYLALGYPAGALEIYREIILRPDIATSEYQMAYARAWQGLALLRLGRTAEAIESLNAGAAVLADYQDRVNAGRTLSLLAEAQQTIGQTEGAVATYAAALDLFLRQGDALRAADMAATEAAHHLEAVTAQPGASETARTQAGQLAATVVERRYQAHYTHPVLQTFRQASVAVLAVVLFFTLYLATGTETLIEVGAGTNMVTQAFGEPGSAAVAGAAAPSPSSALSPVISPPRSRQITPQFRANIAMGGGLLALWTYLIAYSIAGLYVITRTSLRRLEESQYHTVRINAEAISCGPTRIEWTEVAGLLRQDWLLLGRPLSDSQSVVLGPEGRRIAVSGQIAWYAALMQGIEKRLPAAAQRINHSVRLTSSPSGIWMMGNLAYVALFVALGYLAPNLLNVPILFRHYALADLRWMIYLGLLVPLLLWLVIVPMRQRLFFNPRHIMPWGVMGTGLALACASFINLGLVHFSLGRPDVIVSLLAVWLVWVGAWAIHRARWPLALRPDLRDAPAYPASTRLGTMLLALLIAILAAPLVSRELISYDALLTGNAARERADQASAAQRVSDARANYTQAVTAYELALRTNPGDTSAYAGLGALYTQFGEWGRAVHAYTTSLQLNPSQPAMWSNLGLAYEGQADALADERIVQTDPARQQRFRQQEQIALRDAIVAYTHAIELQPRNARFALRRGMVYSTLGQSLLDTGERDAAREIYLLAQKDFQRAVQLDPRNADAHNGLGWTHFKTAESYYERDQQTYTDRTLAQGEYQKALDSFQAATRLDPQNANAYNGLAWTLLKLGSLQWSRNERGAARASYEDTVQAFARASQLAPDDPQYAVSLGNARWLVSTVITSCQTSGATEQDLAHYIGLIYSAIADLDRGAQLAQSKGLALDQNVSYYYRELGQLEYILANCTGQDPITHLERAVGYYDRAIAAEPSNPAYFQMRGRLGYVLGLRQPETSAGRARRLELYQRALVDLSFAVVMAPDDHETRVWRSYIALALADLADQSTPAGLAQRESYAITAVTDRLKMLDLARNDDTRRNDSGLLAAAYLKLSWTHYLQGDYQKAIDQAATGLKYDPDNVLLYFGKGLAELALGQTDTARQTYDAGIAAANKLNETTRRSRLNEGIGDLQNLRKDDPQLRSAAEPILKTLQEALK